MSASVRHFPQGQLIVFRVDASIEIGTGHVMRCLTLADALAGFGAECRFVCRAHDGNLIERIREHGYRTIALPEASAPIVWSAEDAYPHGHWLGTTAEQDAQDTSDAFDGTKADWLVVDHYGLGKNWEERLRPYCTRLMCIDDLADRPHDCDVLLDHGLGARKPLYANLVPRETVVLCGPEYALLRPEFAELRDDSLARRRNPSLRKVLVSMGGVDKDNSTGAVLTALARNMKLSEIEVTVCMGPSAPWLEQIQATSNASSGRIRVLSDTPRMAELMYDTDLMFGAAGTTSWERCCLGVPSIVLVLADNQKEVAESLERAGAAVVLKEKDDLLDFFSEHWERKVSPAGLAEMSENAARITHGRGATKVAELMLADLWHADTKER